MRRRTVQDVMTTAVVSAYRGAWIKDVAEMMLRRGVTGMPVIDDDHIVAGVISEADLLAREEQRDRPKRPLWERRRDRPARAKATATTAEELMTAPAITVPPDATLAEAARLMDHHRIKRLPVVDQAGRLLGIVSRRDVLRVFARPDEEICDEIRHEVFGRLLMIGDERVTVRVSHGVVVLGGTLEQRSLIPIAVRLAAATEGVVDVIDDLDYEDDDTTAAAHRVPRA